MKTGPREQATNRAFPGGLFGPSKPTFVNGTGFAPRNGTKGASFRAAVLYAQFDRRYHNMNE